MTDPGHARLLQARRQARHKPQRRLRDDRRARRGRLRLLVLGAASSLTLVLATGSWVLASYVSTSLGRVNAGTSGTPASGPVNILVAGIDTRSGLTRHQEIELHVGDDVSMNSDTLMLVHIPASHDSVQEVSLPRDSWVDIPGHGMNKINAAIGIGGPALMVKTVERATGLVINDYVEVDFLGFVKVINALGGVNICLPYAVDDSYTGLHLSAGEHHVDGVTALAFARDRHSFALSDLARISDQQQLLSSLFAEATDSGLLANPFRLQEFLSSVGAAVTVDKGFNLVRLADELRGIRPQDITFTTVPVASLSYMTPTGQSAVLWDKPAAAALFASLRNDTMSAASPRGHHHSSARTARSAVSVDVYNGTWITGLSTSTGRQLSALGFTVHRAGLNWRTHTVASTLIQYPPGQLAAARLLRAVVPGAHLQAVQGLARLRLILGAAGYSVAGPPASASTPPPAPGEVAVAGQERTAVQDACR
ncbi:MAG TPA: LCP family protein [Streptosporangiaceae bacterium]|nr:LCP family protein [Streptosporangiaceae bacterium]